MNEELMKKAYDHFGGVWPKGYTALVVSTNSNPVWSAGKYDDYSLGKESFDRSCSDSSSWLWVGTKSDLEEYSKSLNGRVMIEESIKKVYEHYNGVWPSRADVVLTTAEGWYVNEAFIGKFSPAWYKDGVLLQDFSLLDGGLNSDVAEPYMDDECGWIIACTEDQFKLYGDSLKKEWMPEVGEECEATWGGKHSWHSFVLGVGFGFFLNDASEWSKLPIDCFKDIEYRPFKTEREKKIEMVLDLLNKDVDPSYYSVRDWVEIVVDAGFINAPSS